MTERGRNRRRRGEPLIANMPGAICATLCAGWFALIWPLILWPDWRGGIAEGGWVLALGWIAVGLLRARRR